MKICLFNENQLGLVEGETVYDVSQVLSTLSPARYPFPRHDELIANLSDLIPKILLAKVSSPIFKLSEVALLSPVANPGKIVAAPVNYEAHLDEAIADKETFTREHVRKIQETGLFLKATSSLIGVSEPIVINLPERRTDHEIELVVIIGKRAKDVKANNALSYIAGYSIGLDITIRGPEERSLRKSLDTYSVLGPWFVTADELTNPHELDMLLQVNGETRQNANTRNLIMNIGELIEFASKYYTLEPGDLIYTGTPEGVGPIKDGDVIIANIAGIGDFFVEVTNQ